MRLSSFSVINYRSITTARKIETSNMTVLVGKNNEGKSNVLKALTLAMDIMETYAINPRIISTHYQYRRYGYDWERDFPISLQAKKPNGFSSIELIFEFTEEEKSEIRTLSGIRLSNYIPVRVSINNTTVKIEIPKKGTAAFADSSNKQKIIDYVCKKINFNFIPAVRTEKDAKKVINRLIENELVTLEESPEYINAMNTIYKLQKDILDNIADQIKTPLIEFLPSVKDIQITIQNEKRRAALRGNIEVVVDDGTPTAISEKGDGIKSLTALALLNLSSQSNFVSVVAIEEPESHLHPESARQLYETIIALSKKHQVVLTTHSALFVNRTNLKENIIVENGKATPVKKIKEIRDVLGTKVSDNLVNAENVLIVEGEDDKIVLEKILPEMNPNIKEALKNGSLIIDYVGGAGNLTYKLTLYRNVQCKYHVLLDNDEAGRNSGQDAINQGLLNIKNTTYTICNGSPNAEIEDCYRKKAYEKAIYDNFGVDLNVPEFKGNKKWSDRIALCFKSQGKLWDEKIEKQVKYCVAEAIPADVEMALNPHKRSSIDALTAALCEMYVDKE